MRPRALLPLALVLIAAAAPPAAGEGGTGTPRYDLPAGFTEGAGSTGETAAAVERALEAVTNPSAPFAAREGWRILAGVGAPAVPAAVEALRESDWFGRSLLVRSLGSMADPRLDPLLAQAALDPAWAVREAAADGIGLASGASTSGVLPGLLRDPSWRVRLAALESSRRRILRGDLPLAGVGAGMLALAGDPDPDVRRAAWLALADVRHPEAGPTLVAALTAIVDDLESGEWGEEGIPSRDPDLLTALRLLRGLTRGWGEDPEVRDLLWDLSDDPGRPLAGHALREWFLLAGPAGAADGEALRRAVGIYRDRGADPDSRVAAERTLVEVGAPAAEVLLETISLPARARRTGLPGDDSRASLELVVRLQGAGAAATLERILLDRSLTPDLRVHAAEIGRRAFPRELAPAFRSLLDAPEGIYGLDAQALKGLAEAGGEEVRALVSQALVRRKGGTHPYQVQVAAAEVLDARPDLRDGEVIRRAIAAETDGDMLARLLSLLRKTAGPDAVSEVDPFLEDPRVRVRRAAAQALSETPGPEAVRLLLRHLDREDGRDADLERLRDLEPRPPEGFDPADLEAVRRLEADRERHRQDLLDRRERNASSVREACVSSLRFAAGEGAAGVLAGLVDHPDPAVRGAAADNLGTLADPAAVPRLDARVAVEEEPGLRFRMLAALAACGGADADAAVVRILDGGDPDLREQALEVLATGRSEARAPDAVLRCLRRPGAELTERLVALQILGRERDPRFTPVLLEVLRTAPPGEERRQALYALGHSGDPAAVGPMAALLPPGSPWDLDTDALSTAITAAEALGELRVPEAAPPLAAVLHRSLPRALSAGAGPATATARQLAIITLNSLGRCGGEAALAALVGAALRPELSRAAERESLDPLRPGGSVAALEEWKPRLPSELIPLGNALVGALTRARDPELYRAFDARLRSMAADARVFALSEEWLSWLAENLGSPHPSLKNRPRWWTKTLLLRRVLENAPRGSEADLEAARNLFVHTSDVSGEYGPAGRHLAHWRSLLQVHAPFQADRDRRILEGLDRVVAAAERLAAKEDGASAEPMLRAFEESGREDRVARLAVEILTDLGIHLDRAVELGSLAVRADASYPPNLRSLGEARLAAGDAVGALQPLQAALQELEHGRLTPVRSSAWYRYYLGKALTLVGEHERALEVLAVAVRTNDLVLDWVARDRALEPLHALERWEEVLREGRVEFDEER